MRVLLRILLALLVPAAVLGGGFLTTMNRDFAVNDEISGTGRRSLDHPAGRIPVAVLLGANGSVATDVLGPVDVLGDSPKFDVYTVSTTTRPVALSGGLTVIPDYTVSEAPTPRIVVVPAFTDPAGSGEAPLRALIERVHDAGGLVMSVCAGARVLARTDVLDGRRATSFWSGIDGLRKSNPRTTWVAGVRWVRDGNVLTTAGVSSGIIAALDLVRQVAGGPEARRIGERVNYPGWDPASVEVPTIAVRHVSVTHDYPYALGATLPWFQPTYGLGLTEGVDEIDVAAAAELYGGAAFTARVVPVAEQPVITTAHGLRLVATPVGKAPGLDRLVVPGVRETSLTAKKIFLPAVAARPGDSAFDPVLRDIASTDGRATAMTAAKYIEYPMPAMPDKSGGSWRIIVLVIVLALLTAGAPMLTTRRALVMGRRGLRALWRRGLWVVWRRGLRVVWCRWL